MVKRALNLTNTLRKDAGIDRAVAYVFAARVFMIMVSTGTVLLIVHFLSKVEQGYHYTLLPFNTNDRIEGDTFRRARLVTILQNAVRWHFLAGVAMAFPLLPSGIVFFRRHVPGEAALWLGPSIISLEVAS